MNNKDKIIKDIQQHNDGHGTNFEEWVLWRITQIALMTAMILDNLESVDYKAESEDKE